MNFIKTAGTLFLLFLITGCGSGGGTSNTTGSNITDSNNTTSIEEKIIIPGNNAALGPIADADVEIYDLNGTKIYSTKTNDLNDSDIKNEKLVDFDEQYVGKFRVGDLNLSDDKLVLVKISNGKDIDSNDDGLADSNPMFLKGSLYAYVYVKDLKENNVSVNEFTTIAAFMIENSQLKEQRRIEPVLKNIRKLVFNNQNLPLYYFNPAKLKNGHISDLDKLKNENVFFDLLNSQTFKNYLENNESIFKDDDKDGLFNDFEIMTGSDTQNSDTDLDGVGDYGEVFAGTDPDVDDIVENEDILYQYQWHLKNTGQNAGAQNSGTVGIDINVTQMWQYNTGNKQIKIGVVDTGIELNHPDLNTQIDLLDSYRYSDDSHDPSPDNDQLSNEPVGSAHGTAVAGIIAAKSWNKTGISGISPSSTLVGLNTFSTGEESDFADALSKNVNVSSNSWGPADGCSIMQDDIIDDILAQKSEEGTVFVFAAGNERNTDGKCGNSNNNSYVNNKYTIPVAAIDANGSYSSYSSYGANVLISAPGGEFGVNYPAIVSTDLTGLDYGFDNNDSHFDTQGNENGDYTNHMNGTSSATPMVSGIVSLMFSVNPNLNYRDIKYILAKTARKVDDNNSQWSQNGAGIWFNPNYGFGLVDAGSAVNMAKTFTHLPAEEDSKLYSKDVDIAIPDNNETGVSVSINVDENITIEYVNLWVSIPDHTYLGDLEIDLVSPSGTVSKLSYGGCGYEVYGELNDKRYGSNQFLDENSEGEWKVIVKDLCAEDNGTLKNVKLKIYGH